MNMGFKKKIKKHIDLIVNHGVKSKISWPFFSFFIKLGQYFSYQQSLHENELANEELLKFFSNQRALTGFFRGLRYPSLTATGSSLFPKLLGSYESELLPFFESISKVSYLKILDIGCAEGYYAIGMAMRFPNAKIFAYDINETALRLCRKMAVENNVAERVVTANFCDVEVLRKTDISERTLIICDCEGYERYLFLKEDKAIYLNCDLIIEIHPFSDRHIKEYLVDVFKNTHAIQFTASFNDERKLFDYQDELEGLSELAKLKSIQEGRHFTMEWMILIAKNHSIIE